MHSLYLKFIYSEKATQFCEILCPMLCQSKVRWRFRKILWPSQNIWTLICNWNKCFSVPRPAHPSWKISESETNGFSLNGLFAGGCLRVRRLNPKTLINGDIMRLSGVLLTTAPPGLTRAGRLNQCDFGYEVFSTKKQIIRMALAKKQKREWRG